MPLRDRPSIPPELIPGFDVALPNPQVAPVVLCSPHAGEWISETVQAEFVGAEPPVMAPTQFAQPAGDMWPASTH